MGEEGGEYEHTVRMLHVSGVFYFISGSLHRQPSVKKIIIPTLRNVPRREGEHHVYVFVHGVHTRVATISATTIIPSLSH